MENLYNENVWFFGRACKELLEAENPVGGPRCDPEDPGATWSRDGAPGCTNIWDFIRFERLELLALEGSVFEPVKFWLTKRFELWLTDKLEPLIGELDQASFPNSIVVNSQMIEKFLFREKLFEKI